MTSNIHVVLVEVYKCPLLARNCGLCGLLDVHYKCIWCGDACRSEDYCDERGNVGVVSREEDCPNPVITSVSQTVIP